MNITKHKDELKIEFRYDQRLVNFVKSLPARRYDPVLKCWFIPVIGSGEIVRTLTRQGFQVEPETASFIQAQDRLQDELARLADTKDTVFDTTLPLMPFQRVGAEFGVKRGSVLIADEVGLGKTIQTLAILKKWNAVKVLVLVPAVLKYQWQEEVKKFLPEFSTQVIDGNAEERAKQWVTNVNIRIANYELLLRDFTFAGGEVWDVIVCDEATRIANIRTKTYKLLQKIKAERKIALTGTPISNRPNELWGIVNWLYPGVLGNYHLFTDRYCVRDRWGGIFGYQNLEELHRRLKPFMIRRKKEEVLKELPEKIYTDIPFKLSEKEHTLYKQITQELLFEIKKEDINKLENPITIQNTLTKMLRLRQIVDGLELVGQNTESTKLTTLKELLPELLTERKAIIFTFFSSMADILERELAEYKPLKITGEVKGRDEIVRTFNENKTSRVLIMTSAGQYGLNLQSASAIIHYDQEWSLAKMVQREGRAHRIGQKESVLVYSLLAKGTVDMYIRRVLHGKRKISDLLLGDNVGMEEIKDALEYGED